MATEELSRSKKLIATMYQIALQALAQAPDGQLRSPVLMAAIEQKAHLNDWAKEVYESSGNTRWRSIFSLSSVGLVKGGYLTKSKGWWIITDEGRKVVQQPYNGVVFLAEVECRYRAWKDSQIAVLTADVQSKVSVEKETEIEAAPKDRMDETIKKAHELLAAELIEKIKGCDPEFFEQLVVKLLLKMGYGGSRQEAGRAVGRTGDGGIDGIINEDRLGLDAIYIQAKRWVDPVGESPIRDFKGALDAKGAQKGVFITTSRFTPAAVEAAKTSRSYKIVLIDGARLANLMIEHDLGVSLEEAYQLKRLDDDFFTED